MNFIRRIGRDEMYIKYVHQLVNVRLTFRIGTHCLNQPPRCTSNPKTMSKRHSRSNSMLRCTIGTSIHLLTRWKISDYPSSLSSTERRRCTFLYSITWEGEKLGKALSRSARNSHTSMQRSRSTSRISHSRFNFSRPHSLKVLGWLRSSAIKLYFWNTL